MKPFAVFDIDGTVFRWQLYHELFDELYRREIISHQQAGPVFTARQAWQSRTASFADYEDRLVDAMEAAMIGLKTTIIDDASEAVLVTKGDRIYRYTADLMTELSQSSHTIIALSGSHQQIVERFARQHPIDIVHGRQFATKAGVFTGAGQMVYGNKAKILQSIVKDNNLSWEGSYAIGDTNSDGDMMELVANPIAFNPDRKLFKRAKENGWKIVVERKDITYQLTHNGQTYSLANI